MTEYKKGDHVSVRGVIQGVWNIDGVTRAEVLFGGYKSLHSLALDQDQIIEKLPTPLPPEPDRKAILRGKHGRLYTYRSGAGGEGWTVVGTGFTPQPWNEDFYTSNGPFDLYNSDGKV